MEFGLVHQARTSLHQLVWPIYILDQGLNFGYLGQSRNVYRSRNRVLFLSFWASVHLLFHIHYLLRSPVRHHRYMICLWFVGNLSTNIWFVGNLSTNIWFVGNLSTNISFIGNLSTNIWFLGRISGPTSQLVGKNLSTNILQYWS